MHAWPRGAPEPPPVEEPPTGLPSLDEAELGYSAGEGGVGDGEDRKKFGDGEYPWDGTDLVLWLAEDAEEGRLCVDEDEG